MCFDTSITAFTIGAILGTLSKDDDDDYENVI